MMDTGPEKPIHTTTRTELVCGTEGCCLWATPFRRKAQGSQQPPDVLTMACVTLWQKTGSKR